MKFVALSAVLGAAAFAGTVKLDGGTVHGTVENGLAVYRGVPYAAPPVGNLRWRPPQPASKWSGVLEADKFGPPCIQQNPATANLRPHNEDCLYLNIWTPAKSESDKLAVMFWIHGGGFTAGATIEKLYHGENLAKKGVVVVTINYRLGALGFLAHPELSAENPKHVSGNYGMLDMIAALQWTQKNIARFGGNPKRVTIFGESAGGIAVSQLCVSPLAKGLFQGAISQSGGSFGPVRSDNGPGQNVKSLVDAEAAGKAWLSAAGATKVADLRKLPAEKILALSQGQRGVTWPIMDRYVIPDDQYRLYESGRYIDVPVLIGYNSDEGQTFARLASPQAYAEGVRQQYGSFADQVLARYPSGDKAVAKTARDLTRDISFGWGTWSWARLQAKAGKSKAYLFYFDQHPARTPGTPQADFGAAHGAECPYVFGHMELIRTGATEEDRALSDTIITYWTNFAKTFNPNGSGLAEWPAYNAAKPQTMRFAHTASAGTIDNLAGMQLLDDFFRTRRVAGN